MIKMRTIIHLIKSRTIFEMTMQSAKWFCKEIIIGIWNFNGNNRSIINKVRTLWVGGFPSVHQRSYSFECLWATKRNQCPSPLKSPQGLLMEVTTAYTADWPYVNIVPKGLINSIPALAQVMAWRRSGDKPLSEPMMVTLPPHICATRP